MINFAEHISRDVTDRLFEDREFNHFFCLSCNLMKLNYKNGGWDCPCDFDPFVVTCPREMDALKIQEVIERFARDIEDIVCQ